MITTGEKIRFWVTEVCIHLLYSLVILLGIFLFPIAYFIRHVLNVEGKKNPLWWWLNYTEDNDWGLSHYKDTPPKRNFWNALKWYQRNPAWNFILLFPLDNGDIEILELYTTVDNRRYHIDWPTEGRYGTLKTYYRVNGDLRGRIGFATPKNKIKNLFVREFSFGTSDRHKFIVKF